MTKVKVRNVNKILKDAIRIRILESDLFPLNVDPEPVSLLAHNGQRFFERHDEEETND